MTILPDILLQLMHYDADFVVIVEAAGAERRFAAVMYDQYLALRIDLLHPRLQLCDISLILLLRQGRNTGISDTDFNIHDRLLDKDGE
ncbi:hypothetical protein EDWATA_01031 [Edwardsiella tarda ATCC 23685]|uniref:Uncharacterized protein n=1 Tax=Edwardsiella tarda ATCC 23685 TaxID=500638 RepID=D4F2T0_EDWTA|nr:hypothetical protein EDWATA_01031 [Edwardsiella tarda ATCC 23685]